MKIGIISDSHDDEAHTSQALEELDDVDRIIHCGDLCAPFMVDLLDGAGKPVDIVFGNVDDRHRTTRAADQAENVSLHGNEASLTFDGVSVYVTHFPDVAEMAAKSGDYDLVCHGHTHEQRREEFGDTVLVNPGELLGRQEDRGYAVLETTQESFCLFFARLNRTERNRP